MTGAFNGPGSGFQTLVQDDAISFFIPGISGKKTYRLTQSGIAVDLSIAGDDADKQPLQVPVLLDPWKRFIPGWTGRYSHSSNDNEYSWNISEDAEFVITSSAELEIHSFLESLNFFSQTEDPNFDYSASHFFPFPTDMVKIYGTGNINVALGIETDQ